MKKGFFLLVWATESFTEALSLFLSPNTRRRDREEEGGSMQNDGPRWW